MGALSFYCFVPRKTHGTFANIFKSCEKQDFFFSAGFLSLPPRRCFFLRRARQCQARLGSSWMPRASGGRGKKNKVGEILLISSCRFPFLYLTMALLFCLTHSQSPHHFLSFNSETRNLCRTGQGKKKRKISLNYNLKPSALSQEVTGLDRVTDQSCSFNWNFLNII